MSTQTQPQESAAYAPLDAELAFTCQVEILGVRGPLTITGQRLSSIQRVLRLVKQNGLLVEQGPPERSTERTQRTTQCRSCGAPIVFRETQAGKKAPFDVLEDGSIGESHFASCPDADQYRTRRGAS